MTTPLTLDVLDELDELEAEELVPDAVPPDAEEPPDPPEPPDGAEVADCDGEGNGVRVVEGDGDGVTVVVADGDGVSVVVGDGEGLPESLEAAGSPSLAYRAVAGAVVVSAVYVVVAAPLAWLDASVSAEASSGVVSTLDVVVADGELLAELVDELAAPPPRATDVVPLAELSVKSAETVCEMVPLVTFAVM